MNLSGSKKYLYFLSLSLLFHVLMASAFDSIVMNKINRMHFNKSPYALNVLLINQLQTKVYAQKMSKNVSLNKKLPIKSKKTKHSKTSFQKAKMIGQFRPEYPPLSWEQGETGEVVVKVFIDPQGNVQKIELIQSAGFLRLDQAVLVALTKEKFIPARRGQLLLSDALEFRFRFVLN